jgi:hypothetical protein
VSEAGSQQIGVKINFRSSILLVLRNNSSLSHGSCQVATNSGIAFNATKISPYERIIPESTSTTYFYDSRNSLGGTRKLQDLRLLTLVWARSKRRNATRSERAMEHDGSPKERCYKETAAEQGPPLIQNGKLIFQSAFLLGVTCIRR